MAAKRRTFNSGPYFHNQHQEHCGHYFPDVLRLGDKKEGTDYYRVFDCASCGTYSVRHDPQEMSDWLRKTLDKEGSISVLGQEDIEKSRNQALDRLLRSREESTEYKVYSYLNISDKCR